MIDIGTVLTVLFSILSVGDLTPLKIHYDFRNEETPFGWLFTDNQTPYSILCPFKPQY
jgi:hypothetical protein